MSSIDKVSVNAAPPARALFDHGMSFAAFVAIMAALMATNALAIDSMLPALPNMGEALGIPRPNDRQWIVTSYLLGFGAAQLLYGPLADRYGRKPVLLIGMALFTATSLLATVAGSFALIIAARVLQGAAAASTRVLAIAMIRDCYSGRVMARVMSLTMIVFLAAPILAPSLGQLILLFASWRWIFGALAFFGFAILILVAIRVPETLHPEDRMPIAFAPLLRAARLVVTNRYSLGYTVASTLTMGGLFAFIASVQQIYTDIFGIPQWFPLLFALCASTMAMGSFLNARIVLRLGTRRVSHSAMIGFVAVSLVHVLVVLMGAETVWTFTIIQATLMGCVALTGSNFSAMAMEPVGHVAGTAASIQGAFSTLGAAAAGMVIGQAYDGTTLPISLGYLALGLLAVTVVFVAEGGRLFRAQMAPPQ